MRNAHNTAIYAIKAGRINTINGHTSRATISPLASPKAFAMRHNLRLAHFSRIETKVGFIIASMYENKDGLAAVVAGALTPEWDEHAATRIEDLDFAPKAVAEEELHIAIDELFGDAAPEHRSEALRNVA